ncbi:HAMP domain-containing sensor histidine kinase [Hydrocarboniphaga effusa]|jgi:signal transduction histidine kinase|uniref:HAMP domain-containing sensor histidine kinase n=1 Tax=Hydrocarboniphaga effusa TaxID=243629 RepID=UPI0031378903
MKLLHSLLQLPRKLYQRVPLSLRVALLISPVIVVGQMITMVILRDALPVSVLRSGLDFGPQRPPPRFMPEPGFDYSRPFEDEFLGPRPEMLRPDLNNVGESEGAGWRRARAERTGDGRLTFGPQRWIPPWQYIIAIFFVTALIVWAAAWWLMRPLARLSSAAEQLGRNVESEPLAESGSPEIRRAAAAFNRMQDRLLRFLHGRADALLAMSHDLKTPITRLQLRVALLPDDLQGPIAEDVGTLQKRVEEALTFMRGTHSGEPSQDVDVNALAALVVERLQDTGADVSIEGRARALRCRPGQLERALANVLENAVRYAGSAELTVIDGTDALTLRVRDHGPGIPDALLKRVTEPFFRVESSRNRDSGGTGLGLAITKDLVESMGGELHLRNHPNGGLEVDLVVPRIS